MSFTFDAWTSRPSDPYLSITGHYIDASVDQPNEWVLRTEQLAFVTIEGQHTGKNMALFLTQIINRYDLHGKVGWFTCDGTAVNSTTLHEFETQLDSTDGMWMAQEHKILYVFICLCVYLFGSHEVDAIFFFEMHGTLPPPFSKTLCPNCLTCFPFIHSKEGLGGAEDGLRWHPLKFWKSLTGPCSSLISTITMAAMIGTQVTVTTMMMTTRRPILPLETPWERCLPLSSR